MAIALMRSAYSTNIKTAMDMSCALCDADGRLIAQGLTLPLHLGSIPDAMREVRRKFDGRIEPGRRVPAQRPVPGRHAPARLLPVQADLRRRAARRLVGEHRPPDRRRRQDARAATAPTRPRSTRRAPDPAGQAVRGAAGRSRPSSTSSRRTCACRTWCSATCAPRWPPASPASAATSR